MLTSIVLEGGCKVCQKHVQGRQTVQQESTDAILLEMP